MNSIFPAAPSHDNSCPAYFFPKSIQEIWEDCDLVITANKDVVEYANDNSLKAVLIKRKLNEGCKAELSYDNLSDVIDDEEFFNKVK